MCEEWMRENNSQFALGTATYTLGDVILTSILSALYSDQDFFNKEVLGNNIIKEYWERV